MIEKQELHCHECGQYVQFELDMSVNGNHVLNCPVCDHEHCRVIENGRITNARWDSRNGGMTVTVSHVTSSTTAQYDTTSSASGFLANSWLNTTNTTSGTYYTF